MRLLIRISTATLVSIILCVSAFANGRVETVRPCFYFDCGTEDSPLIFTFNSQLAGLMFEKKIPHEFRQLPGDHSWAYWDRQVREILKLAAQKMRLPQTKATRTVRA